jgi:hypothetical protein
MAKLKLAAARVRQGDLVLYTTALKVKELIVPNFYSVETLDPEEGSGFQRLLNEARARTLADYIIKGQESRDAFLPTSVFLATAKDIPFNETDNTKQIIQLNLTHPSCAHLASLTASID